MSDFVYYCKHCNTVEVDVEDNVNLRCPECNQKYYPLHVTEDEWNEMSDDEIRELLTRATAPRKVPVQINSNNEMDKQKEYPKQSVNAQKKSSGKDEGASGMSIAAFILSFFGCTSLIGLILGIIDLTKKNGRKKGLSIAAVTISGIMLIISIILLVSNPFKNDKDSSTINSDLQLEVENNIDKGDVLNRVANQSYTIAGITFENPEYVNVSEEDDTSTTFAFQESLTEGMEYIYLFYDLDGTVVTDNDFVRMEGKLDELIDSLTKDDEISSKRVSATYAEVAGFKSRRSKFDFDYDNIPMNINVDLINNTAEKCFVLLLYYSSPKFDSVYDDIIASAKYTGEKNSNSMISTGNTNQSKKDSSTVSDTKDSADSSGVNPELKAFLDEYEAFMREYVDFMKKYISDPTNVLSMLNDYTKMVERAEEFSKKADEYDASKDDMSKEDLAYYIDTIARIEKMYLEVLDMQ